MGSAGSSGASAVGDVGAEGDPVHVTIAGRVLVADVSGALWWPAERMLVVADLHLEKGSAHAARGVMLPPYDTRETLGRLATAIGRLRPRTIVALGDSLHDRRAASRIGPDDAATLARLQRGRAWIWVTGNHDPDIAPWLGGEVAAGLDIGGLRLQHMPPDDPEVASIAGHLHPAARLASKGHRLRGPCFVGDRNRLVLPAFGAFTGGLNILDSAFGSLVRGGAGRVWMLGRDGVYPIPLGLLCQD
jgi:uncharacterized protein